MMRHERFNYNPAPAPEVTRATGGNHGSDYCLCLSYGRRLRNQNVTGSIKGEFLNDDVRIYQTYKV